MGRSRPAYRRAPVRVSQRAATADAVVAEEGTKETDMFNPYNVEAVGREQQRDLERALSHKVRIAEARRGQRAQERMTGVKGGLYTPWVLDVARYLFCDTLRGMPHRRGHHKRNVPTRPPRAG